MNLLDLMVPDDVRVAAAAPLWQNDGIPDGSHWWLGGREVVVRGASPRCVWFTAPGASQLTQTTVAREEFLRKARRHG